MERLRAARTGLSLMCTAPPRLPGEVQPDGEDAANSSRRIPTRFTAVSASEASSLVGRRLGRFKILSRIGQGGLATVWRAHDELLGRDVALKVLNESIAESPKVRRRFIHEAKAGSSLEHPGIVTVFEAGETDGLAWMALTLVEGETVSGLAANRLLPIDEAVRVATSAADALAHAHSRGVIHRDVSGRNVMVANDGRVFVLDFGLALAVGLSRVTTSETTLGTIAYMAPEALLGTSLDVRADVYGLGVVLFEALTGAYPHRGDRTEQLAHSKLNSDARKPSELRPEIPPELDFIVGTALARDPSARYATMAKMLHDLRICGRGAGIPAQELTRDFPRRAQPPIDRTFEDRTTVPDPAYLAILPFTQSEDADGSGVLAQVASRLTLTLAAMFGAEPRIRVVPVSPDEARSWNVEREHEWAQRVGANLVLSGQVARAGVRVRVTYSIRDPARALQVGGNVVDGSDGRPFDLEDEVLASVRSALGIHSNSRTPSGVARDPDPAAEDKFRLAQRYLVRNENEASVDGAIRLLEGLVESEPADPIHLAVLGSAYLCKWRLTGDRSSEIRAARICQSLSDRAETNSQALLLHGEIDEAAGRIDDARSRFEAALETEPGLIGARLGLVRLLDREQRWDEAEAACRDIIRDCPGDWRAYKRMGLVHFHRGDYAGCIEPWSRVIELIPDSPQAHTNLGSAMYHLDRIAEAIAAYERALEIQPGPQALTNLGTALFYAGRYDEAVATLERAANMNTSDPEVWGNLGNACRYAPGGQPRMREALDRAVALMRDRLDGHPRDAEGRARLAGWLMNLGRGAEALDEIRIALEMAPRSVACMARAGYVHADAGDDAEAVCWFRKAIQNGYGTRELERSPALAHLRAGPEFQRVLEEGRDNRSIGAPHTHRAEDGRPQ